MKNYYLIGIFSVFAFSLSSFAVNSASEVLKAFSKEVGDDESFEWVEFDQREAVAIPQIETSLKKYDFSEVEKNEDWTLYEGYEPGADRKNSNFAQAYKLTASFTQGPYLYLIQYEIEPKCTRCLKRLDEVKKTIALAKHPEEFSEAGFWAGVLERISSLSWTTTIGTGLSLAFAVQYYRTGSPYMAAVSVASLGLLFVCPCNGRIKLGLCPQKMTVFGSALLALIGMNQARQGQH